MVARVLDPEPLAALGDHLDSGGGRALEAADRLGPAATVEELMASGLRGRGGAGFPTGVKWRTVSENVSPTLSPIVVVNAAEGEPGTFKDRTLLRRNPYKVLEGALVAARTLRADTVVLALKASFTQELARVRAAIDEVRAAGWAEGVELYVVEGPGEYLYGEETGLLEVINGRQPFPRIAPPFRHGVDEAGGDTVSSAEVAMAGPEAGAEAPPTLVNNVETLANVAALLAEGADWYRQVGTAESPGTVVCTVTGRTRRHGVGEFALGTPLAQVIDELAGGPGTGHRVAAVLSGVAHPLLPGSRLDTPVTYEHLEAAGAGLGSAGFIVFDDGDDLAAVAHGVSRFLAVESCGQCTPCKQDGLALADALDKVRRSEAGEADLELIERRSRTVSEEARCFLAHQHERVVSSVVRLFPDALRAHVEERVGAVPSELVSPIVDIVDGVALLDERHRDKQPDWTYGVEYSGQSPADRFDQREAGAR